MNQVVLVTGAGRGIGKAVALALAADGFGVAVVARSRDEVQLTADEITAAGGACVPVLADVRDPASVERAVSTTMDRFGQISLLVNNAGSAGPAGKDWEVDPDAWWECIEGAVRGAFLFNHAVIPGMIAAGTGRIVHVASLSGTRAFPGMMATSIAKTAVIRLNEGLAAMLESTGIATFAIHPGVVDTALLRSYGLSLPASMFSPPEAAAELCTKLASGRYDALSGRFITIADDLDALVAREDEIRSNELLTLRVSV